jgi:V/A-type H+-transporting ATPase subunit I
MAGRIHGSMPGIGLLFALLILLIGHGLNFVLSLSSAVIHGLRLNVIEFFNWGLPEEGALFRPFRRKERRRWSS